MAFVWKHPESKFWIARFQDANGCRRNRSTKETNRKKAERLAEHYELAARNRRTAQQVRRVITELHRELTGEEMVDMSVQKYIEEWLAAKKPEVEPATLQFYRNILTKFCDSLGEKAKKELSSISSQDILTWRNKQAETLASKTVNHGIKVLRMFFKAARRERFIADDPAADVSTLKVKTRSNRRPFLR